MKLFATLKLFATDLTLFDEAVEAAVSTPEVAAPEAVTEQSTEQSTEQPAPVDKSKAFEDLIKGEYKEQFHTRTQGIIDERFKQSKQIEERYNKISPVLELLSQKFGVEDPEQILKMLDEEVVNDQAYKNDMSPDAYRKQMQADKIIKAEQERKRAAEQQQIANKAVENWFKEADELKSLGGEYAEIDLQAELKNNSQFRSLLTKNGLSVKHAYDLTHIDNYKQAVLKQSQQQTIDNIQAKQKRPEEAAAKSQSGVAFQSDTMKLSKTKEGRAELARRAMRGETIDFNK